MVYQMHPQGLKVASIDAASCVRSKTALGSERGRLGTELLNFEISKRVCPPHALSDLNQKFDLNR